MILGIVHRFLEFAAPSRVQCPKPVKEIFPDRNFLFHSFLLPFFRIINEEQAANLRKLCENYLSGMSFVQAAKDVGLEMKHSGVKRLMQNPRYLGDDFYPAILTAEIAQAVEAERLRRDALYKGTRYTKEAVTTVIPTRFAMKRTAPKYQDPIKQAEYAYSQIKEAK